MWWEGNTPEEIKGGAKSGCRGFYYSTLEGVAAELLQVGDTLGRVTTRGKQLQGFTLERVRYIGPGVCKAIGCGHRGRGRSRRLYVATGVGRGAERHLIGNVLKAIGEE